MNKRKYFALAAAAVVSTVITGLAACGGSGSKADSGGTQADTIANQPAATEHEAAAPDTAGTSGGQGQASSGPFPGLLQGDFSAVAGTWVNWRNEEIQLGSNGTFEGLFAIKLHFDALGTRGEYRGILTFYDEDGKVSNSDPIALYPAGVDVEGLVTDTTKVRLCTTRDNKPEEDVLYLEKQ